MNKRGIEIELGWQFLFNALLVIAFIIIIVVWINSQASGAIIKKQVLAKELCMFITEAKPDTTISIQHGDEISIEKKDSGILVKEGIQKYLYPCYIEDNVYFSKENDRTIIDIR